MVSEMDLPTASGQARVARGVLGRWLGMWWRRTARRMREADVDELRKRVVILTRQLDGLPVTSSIRKRRIQLLRDRERCQTIIAEWERLHESGEAT
jgi:hypothetical protein